MSKIATTLAVLMLALTGSAFAQDYRSPDARPAVVQQDFRSPDARATTVAPSPGFATDLRSPDARPSGLFQPSVPSGTTHASNSFDWGYLVLGIATALILLAAFAVTQRRRRHGLAIGS